MMLTRCPHCATTFRVTPEQLKTRRGKVRCGKCRAVFNALESLEEEAPVRAAAWGQPEPAVPAPAVAEAARAIEPPLAADDPTPEPSLDTSAAVAVTEPESEIDLPVETEPAVEMEPEPARIIPRQAEPELLLHESTEPRHRRWPWLLAGLFALGALGFQATVRFRAELALAAPELARPALLAICEIVGCTLELPRKVDLIGIETSDLIPDKEKPGHLELVATLRNRATHAQVWPHLEITLTDTTDHALLRRALGPADYLPASAAKEAGFPPQSEQTVQLALQTTDVPAVGYRLYVFYP